jgi:hypothetical protein
MVKENVLRKNLLTNKIDFGNIDTEFEAENLKGNIINDSPWIEISESDETWKAQVLCTTKTQEIKNVKLEAARRIDAVYPQYKQINYSSAVLGILNKENHAMKLGNVYVLNDDDKLILDKVKEGKNFIDYIRFKSDELEALINSKETIEELICINIIDNIYWS